MRVLALSHDDGVGAYLRHAPTRSRARSHACDRASTPDQFVQIAERNVPLFKRCVQIPHCCGDGLMNHCATLRFNDFRCSSLRFQPAHFEIPIWDRTIHQRIKCRIIGRKRAHGHTSTGAWPSIGRQSERPSSRALSINTSMIYWCIDELADPFINHSINLRINSSIHESINAWGHASRGAWPGRGRQNER